MKYFMIIKIKFDAKLIPFNAFVAVVVVVGLLVVAVLGVDVDSDEVVGVTVDDAVILCP